MPGTASAEAAAAAGSARADSLRTKRALARVYGASPSGRLLVSGLAAAAGLRLAARAWTPADAVVAGLGVALTGPLEWAVHRHLFHAPSSSFRRRRLGLGVVHGRHHTAPADLDWLLLPAGGAAVLSLAVCGFSFTWTRPIAALVGAPAARPAMTAAVVGLGAVARYEWLHLLVHSRYRPHTTRVRRLVANHRRHHHRDADRWFGVTATTGDRLFGTS